MDWRVRLEPDPFDDPAVALAGVDLRPRRAPSCRRDTRRTASPARWSPARRGRCSRAGAAGRRPRRGNRRCTAPSSTAAGCRRCGRRAARARASAAATAARAAPRPRCGPAPARTSGRRPGGSTPSSSRSTPELPPLSNIVTTACSRSHGLRFRPPRRLGRPVPPPKQPTLSSRSCMCRHSILVGAGPPQDPARAGSGAFGCYSPRSARGGASRRPAFWSAQALRAWRAALVGGGLAGP